MIPAEPLSPLDAAFLAAETPAMPMHVVAVTVLDPGPAGLGVACVRPLVVERLADQRRLWQRVVRVPFGLDHPMWVDDPLPDMEHHVRAAALPAPGGQRELGAFVAELASRALDPDRPLWELVVLEGLEGGHVALVSKVHHALFDGVSGIAALAGLFDLAPGGAGERRSPAGRRMVEDPQEADAPSGVAPPGALDLLAGAARRWARRPLALADTVAGTYLAMRQWTPAGAGAGPGRGADGGSRAGQGGPGPGAAPAADGDGTAAGRTAGPGQPVPFRVPRAPWNGTISPRRASAVVRLAIEDLRAVTNAFGGTLNDVLLASVSGALRRRAARHPEGPGLAPGSPLVAGVPVSVRRQGQATAAGNRVSAMLVPLATDVVAADARYRAVRAATRSAKEKVATLPEHLVVSWAELAVPALATRVARLAANLRAFDRIAPVANVVVSNVPGPTEPLWLGEGRVVDLYPFGPVVDGVALNVSAVSYRSTLYVGLIACRDLVPDIDELAGDLADAARELAKAARAAGTGSTRRGADAAGPDRG